ncbi:MAG: ribonuclease HI [Myxococcales bacterium]|nr:ribonuclease HI [Myxococcales bacterium]
MPWVSRMLRGERVYVKVGSGGEPTAGGDGRVDIVYKPGGKVYRAGARNLSPDPDPKTLPDSDVAPAGAAGSGVAEKGRAPVPADAIIVYTDGACSGNPGPAGLGVVILDGGKRRELSEYLGVGTNNIAELMAIVRALEEVPRDRTIVLHADSSYALGLLGKGWKAKANQEIVERMRKLARDFRDLRLVKVDGHADVAENERADELARTAIVKRT